MSGLDLVASQVLNGLALGFIYVLVASGLSVIFGLTDIINFAHGGLYMVGAYVGFTVLGLTGNFWIALLVAPLVVGALGMAMERSSLHYIYDRDPLYHIVATFGITLMINAGVKIIWGREPLQFDQPALFSGPMSLGPLVFSKYKLLVILVGLTVAVGVWLIFRFTDFGLIVRAGAQNQTTVRFMGFDVTKYFTLVFGLAAALAGVAGVLVGPMFNVNPQMGDSIIITAFVIVIFGGLGSYPGSVLAALTIGVVQTMGNAFFPQFTGFSIFIVMIGVLVVRPEGLLGEYEVRGEATKVSFDEIVRPLRLSDRRMLAVLALLAVVPLGTNLLYSSYYVGLVSLLFIWAVFAISLDVALGFTGLISFGHAAFFGLGAYATALTVIHLHNSFLLAVVVAVAVTAAVAWVIGALSIRFSGVYFALITLGFAEIFHRLAVVWDGLTGGSNGLAGMPSMRLLGVNLADTVVFYYFSLLVLVGVYAFALHLLDSPFGRAMMALRESERRLSFLGYRTNTIKRRVFTLSGAIGGVAGALFATYQTFVSPETLHWSISGFVLIATILGGMGTLYGPILGAGVFIALREVLSSVFQEWELVFGILLVLVTIYAPHGLISVYGAVTDRLGSVRGGDSIGPELTPEAAQAGEDRDDP